MRLQKAPHPSAAGKAGNQFLPRISLSALACSSSLALSLPVRSAAVGRDGDRRVLRDVAAGPVPGLPTLRQLQADQGPSPAPGWGG